MRISERIRPISRAAVTGGATALVAGLLLAPSMAASAAAPAGGMTMNCQTATFPAFDWTATVEAEAVTDGTTTSLELQFSDLPGIAPVPINNPMTGEVVVEVAGSTVTLSGSGTATAAPNAPVPVPPVIGEIDGEHTSLDVTVTSVAFTVAGLTTNCPPSGAGNWPLDAIAVEAGVVDVPDPTPTATDPPSDEPTDEPTDDEPSDSGNKKGKPAQGTAKFSCTLQEIGSPFDYNPKVTVAGSRAAAGDSEVTLRATFSDIPGLAPVPIENGNMKVTASMEIGDETVDFAASSTVNAAAHGKVPVPVMTATIDTDEETLPVKVTAFKFDFGEMQGMHFYSDCEGGGTLSKMTVGIGDLGDDDDTGPGSSDDTNTTNTAPSLPKTGAGSAMLMFGLWASAFVLLGAALFLFLPRRRPTA